MEEFLGLAASSGWQEAIRTFLPARAPDLITTIEDRRRINWVELLSLNGTELALDYGCGLGGVTVPLSKRVGAVVAVDGCLDRIRFLQLRIEQERMENIITVCSGEPYNLPFSDSTFDLVVLNMVFPYFASSKRDRPWREVEHMVLKEFTRILRPGGQLYITVRHKFSLYRQLQHLLRSKTLVEGFIYHRYGYFLDLLRRSGYGKVRSYWPIPEYRRPVVFLPLDCTRMAALESLRALPTFYLTKAIVVKLLARIGHLHNLAETMAFVCVKDQDTASTLHYS